MSWDLLHWIVSVLSLTLAVLLWYRTIVSENPVIDIVPIEVNPDGDTLQLEMRVRNPGRHALIIHGLIFRSPERSEVGISLTNDRSTGDDVQRLICESDQDNKNLAIIDEIVEPSKEFAIYLTLPELNRSLNAQLIWTKQTPIIFPWKPSRIRRTPAELKRLASAAPSIS